MSNDQFYLQDSRSYVGNDVLWWASHGGYTTDLSKAQVYTRTDAIAHHDARHSDVPWPKDYIDARTRPAVDMQHIKRAEAMQLAGITLKKDRPPEREASKCEGCGRFLKAQDLFGPCPHCGTDNSP